MKSAPRDHLDGREQSIAKQEVRTFCFAYTLCVSESNGRFAYTKAARTTRMDKTELQRKTWRIVINTEQKVQTYTRGIVGCKYDSTVVTVVTTCRAAKPGVNAAFSSPNRGFVDTEEIAPSDLLNESLSLPSPSP